MASTAVADTLTAIRAEAREAPPRRIIDRLLSAAAEAAGAGGACLTDAAGRTLACVGSGEPEGAAHTVCQHGELFGAVRLRAPIADPKAAAGLLGQASGVLALSISAVDAADRRELAGALGEAGWLCLARLADPADPEGQARLVAGARRAAGRGQRVRPLGADALAWTAPAGDAALVRAGLELALGWLARVAGPGGGPARLAAGLVRLGGDPLAAIDAAAVALERSASLGAGELVLAPEPEQEPDPRQAGLAGLRALAQAIDLKDPTTVRHSERVAELAERLGAELGWPDRRLARLRQAALLHDVGKIVVPDAILFKPGPLTEAERAVVQQHADYGGRIAAQILDPEQVTWIMSHHERFDGAGYPHGLAGEAIPEGARILALADAFDAMTVARGYRQPLTRAQALAECAAGAGGQFCPEAARALARLARRGELPLTTAA